MKNFLRNLYSYLVNGHPYCSQEILDEYKSVNVGRTIITYTLRDGTNSTEEIWGYYLGIAFSLSEGWHPVFITSLELAKQRINSLFLFKNKNSIIAQIKGHTYRIKDIEKYDFTTTECVQESSFIVKNETTEKQEALFERCSFFEDLYNYV